MGLFGVRASQAASRFAGDRSGNFAVLTGVSMLPIVLAVGFCVNLAQAYQVKSSLQAALDSAMTSTARNITTGAIKKEDARKAVEKFLLGNAAGRFADKGEFVLDTLVTDDAAKTLEGTAYAYVDSAFPLFGKDPKVSVTSAALYSDKKVEIAMMLDITGSMKADRKKKTDKIGDLQTAAKNAVDLAMKQNRDPKNPRVRVAIVPYAQAVNAGALADDVVFVEKPGGSNLPPAEDAVILAKVDPNDNGQWPLPEATALDRTIAPQNARRQTDSRIRAMMNPRR
ncbi:TadE/TadG family type IV pilus assembly protein [Mesorhizobium sp. ASY16-5R]|uniref:TadE/TadG family type IV pilus assembly protein n=1 Tax=Mesorhizobium sp. ASY16-5R TaxID=3445772 RepID=UPI003F9FDADD